MKKNQKVNVFKDKIQMIGIISKICNNKVVIVNVNGKDVVGRIVHNWIEI